MPTVVFWGVLSKGIPGTGYPKCDFCLLTLSPMQIMETILRIFSGRSATVHEEAMLAVGSFTYALGKQFR